MKRETSQGAQERESIGIMISLKVLNIHHMMVSYLNW